MEIYLLAKIVFSCYGSVPHFKECCVAVFLPMAGQAKDEVRWITFQVLHEFTLFCGRHASCLIQTLLLMKRKRYSIDTIRQYRGAVCSEELSLQLKN